MKQELLVTRDPWQTQVAVVEDGRLAEFVLEPSHLNGLVGNLYVGKVSRIMAGVQGAFVDIGLDRDGFLFEGDMGPGGLFGNGPEGAGRSPRTIKDLKEGDRILVQVSKEPMGPKGARLSTQVALPSTFLIFLPFMNHVGVSRSLEEVERRRLKKAVRRLKGNTRAGFIIRTAAEGLPEEELARRMQGLVESWALVRLKALSCEPATCVHQEEDILGRTVREILMKGDGSIVTDDGEVARRCREILGNLGLDTSRVAEWEEGKKALFDHYRVQEQIEKALRPRVWLPSGGCIVVQSTEALVAIDVNSGRYAEKKSLEETALAINLEAAEEIVRQVRLRGLGGIIIIDFIDMIKKAHREAVFQKLGDLLKQDRARSRILTISEFGLVEMTRKRSHRNLERVMTSVCPCCEGRGRLPASWRIAQQVAYAVEGLRPPKRGTIRVSPEVCRYLKENKERFAFPEGISFKAEEPCRPSRFQVERE